jgi:ornithine cyclodeaminase/alanine dehydrogenase-like protein (mu-crystallin family)
MSKIIPVELKESPSIEAVEQESDIFVLATDSTTSITDGSHLKHEVLVITMGANATVKHEVSTDLIQRMDLVVTDDIPTAQYGSGDLVDACESGLTQWEDVIPLERIVSGEGPTSHGKRILFQSNGIADEDLAVARYVWDQVQKKKLTLKSIPGL